MAQIECKETRRSQSIFGQVAACPPNSEKSSRCQAGHGLPVVQEGGPGQLGRAFQSNKDEEGEEALPPVNGFPIVSEQRGG